MATTTDRAGSPPLPSDEDLGSPSRWNETATDYPTDRCLHELIEAQVDRTPDRIAVAYEDVEITYADLNARANRVASRLRTLGVGPDMPVGVCLHRSPELVTALLAVLKAGGAYLPLDPEYPRKRLAFMAEDTDIDVILTHGSAADVVPDTRAEVVRVDDVWTGGAGEDRGTGHADPTDLAYVMYTSGSTGRPKGVMVEHRSIVNRLQWMQGHYGLGADDVAVQKTPFSFDVSVWEFFWPLMTGARLQVARPGGHKDGGYLARLVEEAGVTVIHFVPSMLDLFLEVADVERRCRSLQHVICSGEALPRDLVDRFFERIGDEVALWNLYGPTEAAVDVTWWRCEPESTSTTVPIGRPVANTRIHVVDESLDPVPVGEVGELIISGIQVARGYWNRPELTADTFIPEPVPAKAGGAAARAYRTGDRARWLDEGVIEFLGRVDHQVKIRGQRIELGEVEAALRRQTGVLQAAAVVRDDAGGEPRLVAYVVPADDSTVDTDALRAGLATELPEAMVPARFVLLDEMPLSPNGKLDRSALPEPSRERPDLDRPYAGPRDDLERYLTDSWADLLELERVGIHDPFFELGGSSLRAARFVNDLQEELDEFIYVITVFDSPTVAAYADFLRSDYPEAVEERFGRADETPTESSSRRIDAAAIDRMSEAVPRFPLDEPPAARTEARNEPAVFILAPPRSGTTLLRVMLAGHPGLFAATELQLLHFERLGQRREAFSGKFEVWLDGVIRALMELEGREPDEVRERMAEHEAEDMPVRDFYRRIQERLDGRILIDKTPSYALDPHALRRAERDFRDARYIHLVRHPYAVVESFVTRHMEQILFLHDHPFGPRELGELVWLLSHRNVRSFLEDVPARRQHRLRFEDLVQAPEAEMRALCERLDIPFHSSLLHPYRNLDRKMVDGVHDDSTPMGDTRLMEREGIDPSVADRWRGVLEDDYLGEPTWSLAEALGYERPGSTVPSSRIAAAPQTGSDDRIQDSGRGRDDDAPDPGSRGALRRRRLQRRRSQRERGTDPGGED